MPDPKKADHSATPPPDNPERKDFSGLKDDGRRYRVVNTSMLGSHQEGSVVSAIDLGPGAQIARLLAKGKLVELDETEAKQHPGIGGRVAHGLQMTEVLPPPPEQSTGNPGGALIGKPEEMEAERARAQAREAAETPSGSKPHQGEAGKGGK